MLNWKTILYVGAIVLILILSGGLGYVITRPTTTQKADHIENKTINTEKPFTPLVGCSIWRLNTKVYWERTYQEKK